MSCAPVNTVVDLSTPLSSGESLTFSSCVSLFSRRPNVVQLKHSDERIIMVTRLRMIYMLTKF